MKNRPTALDVAANVELEQISVARHPTGAWAIIVVHDTTRGPALGGCRMGLYENLDAAVEDAIGLAEGMTYKNALADLPLGGGKSVLFVDRNIKQGREALFRWFAERVNEFGGRYITAEDMGTRVADIEVIREVSTFVSGSDPARGGGGDPSPWTALGVFQGMRACLERLEGSEDFSGKTVAIQGVGNVGSYLLQHLHAAGARLLLADPNSKRLSELCKKYGAEEVSVSEILTRECDILAPCAVSHVLTRELVPKLRCRVVAGAANIQLAEPEVDRLLHEAGILYAPDFAINSGGVILCADELEEGGFSEDRVRGRVLRIYETIKNVFSEADARSILPGEAALLLAKQNIVPAHHHG